ncbi:hypothetical protein F9230_07605 [Acinetobacter johnsonii]|uniref:hypothetical protein n=1 Tax=Acinetobacter TaxID=469 RepID=UPI000A3364B0|nr:MULTISPECIES: hypothetical protein [Acinetobacter]OTG58614.1 hypothetical protein B9T36_09670 [Acinetobacter sp. ANC 4204]UJA04222.1 hypothetical protein F9230_07605 [Acinetobacter johnsonii]
MAEKEINWEKIELDYRAGVKSIRQIAAENEIAESGIRRRAKQYEWVRDLSEKIKAKADDIVRKESVRSVVRTKTTISEKDTIDANANEVASVRLAHRKDIQRSRKIAMSLFDELEMMVGQENVKLLEMLGELMWSPDDKGNDKVNDLYMKIISMPGRVKSMKDLSDTLKTLIALERQAFGLDDENNKPVDALTALLERVSTGNSSAFKPIADDPEY